MKKLALAICVFVGLTGVARAQEIPPSILNFPMTSPCYLTEDADSILEKEYGELPFAIGESIVWNSKVKEYIPVTTRIFVNPKTFSFSIAYDVDDEPVTCIFTTGNDFRPIPKGPKI